jgi:hypothetical protein
MIGHNKVESLKAEENSNGWFSLLVFVSNHAHTNQQFVNCAYLKILHAFAPAPTLCTSTLDAVPGRCGELIRILFSFIVSSPPPPK